MKSRIKKKFKKWYKINKYIDQSFKHTSQPLLQNKWPNRNNDDEDDGCRGAK